jgi:hypothetical protein
VKRNQKTSIVLSCVVATILVGVTWAMNQSTDGDTGFSLTRTELGYTLQAREARVPMCCASYPAWGPPR